MSELKKLLRFPEHTYMVLRVGLEQPSKRLQAALCRYLYVLDSDATTDITTAG